MLLSVGTQERLILETTNGAGSTTREGSIESDALLVGLYVTATTGDVSVAVYTMTEDNQQHLEFTYPTISSPTTELLQRKTGVKFQRFRIVVSYTGTCTYEIYVRAVNSAGESSTRILGSSDWQVTQSSVTTTPGLLIPATLTDRSGLVIKNWSATSTVYIAESLAKADVGIGYPLAPRDGLALDIAAGAAVYAVADTGTADIRIAESGS